MKKLGFVFAILTLTLAYGAPTFASANDFYFSSATFDYYLSKAEDGHSTMYVEESLTAVFPETNQNHGIERCLPTQYRGTDSLNTSSFAVTRNGTSEPFSTYKNEGELCYRIGSKSSYVHGEQTYHITYTLNNVILQPEDSSNQELYWDTNGTGWSQKFNSLTATVHLANHLVPAFSGHTSCYVGKYGSKGSDRCKTEISEDKSTIRFSTANLTARENLSLNLEFLPSSFFVPRPQPNYLLYVLLGIHGVIFIASIFLWINCYRSVTEKRSLAKAPKPVQYIPPKDLTVAEAGQIWLKNAPSLQVASLMELAVAHKVELIKGEKKRFGGYHWQVHVKNLDDISEEQRIVLEILNGGNEVKTDSTIEIKSRTATSHLQSLGRKYTSEPESSLRAKGYLEAKDHKNSASSRVGIFIVLYCLFAFGTIFYVVNLAPQNDVNYTLNLLAFFIAVIGAFVYIITSSIVMTRTNKFTKRTRKGIETSNYLDGLKEYMTLAEANRIKFLHSVKTADVSHAGIVKLYEKLLPYAIMFNIEESWMNELNKYYQMDDVSDPTWIRGMGYFTWRDFRTFSSYTSSSVSSSTAIQSSSSSGFSGSGGGGFSGGGGGGGGGGGW